MQHVAKSVGAVLVGFVSVAVLSVVTDVIVESVGLFPGADHPELYEQWMLAVALAYRSAYTILGGYITARVAPHSPIRHVYTLMILGCFGGIAGAMAGWDLGNHWYPVLLALTGPFFVYLGGQLMLKK